MVDQPSGNEASDSGEPSQPPESSLSSQQAAALFVALAEQLRATAKRISAGEAGRTLQPTALVNEAYVRMFGGRPRSWNDEKHFMCSAAKTMRNILLDHKRMRARRDHRLADVAQVLDDLLAGLESRCCGDLVAVHEAIHLLASEDRECADYVELRFFGGRSNADTCRILDIGERSGERHWEFARSWLRVRLAP